MTSLLLYALFPRIKRKKLTSFTIKVLQAIMGHKDVSVTMNIYNHVTRERVMSQLPKIEKLEL